jgi:O-antigen/teichoic acid export membrane protein
MLVDNAVRSVYSLLPQRLRTLWDRVERSDLGSRMARGVFWSIGGSLISRGLMLTASVMLARLMGREVYGEFGMIRSTLNTFLTFAGFGLGVTATKHVAEFRRRDPDRAGRIIVISELFALGTGLLVSLGLCIFAPWVASHTINAPQLTEELRISAVVLLLNGLNGAQTGALAGFEAFKAIAQINFLVGILSFPTLIFGAYYGGLRGCIYALCVNISINWILNHLALRKEAKQHHIRFSAKGCMREWPILWKFSLPVTLSGILVCPVLWTCNAILVKQPGGYGQMGMYDAANQWQGALLFIPSVVGQIALPLLASLTCDNDQDKYRQILKYNIIINVCAAFLVALPIAGFAPAIMRTYGNKFVEGARALSLLSMSTVLISLNNVVGQAIVSKGLMWIGLLFNVIWACSILTLSWLLVHKGYGVTGLAMANFISYSVHSLVQVTYLWKILKNNNHDRQVCTVG